MDRDSIRRWSGHIAGLALLALLAVSPARAQPEGDADALRHRIEAAEGRERVRLIVDFLRANYYRLPEESTEYGREALALLQRRPDPALTADVLCFMAGALAELNQRDSSLAYAQRSRDLALRTAETGRAERVDVQALEERAGEAERIIGQIHHHRGRYAESEAAYRSALDRFERIKNRSRSAAVMYDLGVLFKTQGRFEDAIAHHTWALEVFKELGMEPELVESRHGLAVVYNLMGRSADALREFHEVLAYYERQNDPEALGNTLSNIGGVYEYQAEYEQALAHYLRAYGLYESLGLKRRMATANTNVAGAHFHLGQLEEAQRRYEMARELAIETENERLLAYINEGMGRVHEQKNEPELARAAFDAALAGFEALGDRRGIATALISVGRLRNDASSTDLMERAVEIATEMRSYQLLRDGHLALSDLYEREGRFDDALYSYKEFKAAHDSLFNAESRTTIARLGTEYQTRDQEQRIALLEQKRKVQRLWLFGILSGVGFLGVITALSFNRVRLRQRALAAQEAVHRAESERARVLAETAEARARYLQAENERKAMELDAARRMQLSMLPREVPRLPQAEVATFMRTAAEVGGDYYDFDVSDDGALTIAIGDATGHGTQAGTMVAAVKSLFSDYASTADLAAILHRSARAIRRMGLPNVYMAFALARLRGSKLELAGAGMPPALIHRAASGCVETVALKGMPLGAPADFPYQMQVVDLRPGDTVVLLSDGFPELRNESGEQFGYEALNDLARKLASQELSAAPVVLEEEIRGWSGGVAVGDDVTVVIVRMEG